MNLSQIMYSKTECPECGENKLSWQAYNVNKTGVTEGRLRTNDVGCNFILGCDYCCETIMVIDADKIAQAMTEDK